MVANMIDDIFYYVYICMYTHTYTHALEMHR